VRAFALYRPAPDRKGIDLKFYQLDSTENNWRGFIYDKDSCSPIVFRYLSGIPTTEKEDDKTVFEARDKARTVVTSNGGHFIRYTKEAQSRSIQPKCDDCWGLVIIPNMDFQREYAFKKAKIKTGVKVGGVFLPWKAAAYANLCVKVTADGRVQVSRFERCIFCERDTPIKEEWYSKLTIL
jgi:hypothetical protein